MFFNISVIVTTKNEEKHIENCLRSILAQNYPMEKIEIIVVDNASTDQTKEIALKYTNKVFSCGPERSAQRNYGVSQAKGEWILYLDADMVLSEEVVLDCVINVKENINIVGLYIPEIIGGEGFFSRVRRFERSFCNGTILDAARFIKREVFNEIGGFDPTLTGPEDWDLDKKLRARGETALIKNTIYHNEADFNLKNYLKKKRYYAKSFNDYVNKWGKNDADVRKQLGFYYRFLGVFIEDGKWVKLISHPLLCTGLYFLRTLVGFQFIIR